ncbi:DcaP family trimeric outer membrane transporter [Dokdonella sp.]|uniref:DcaP family trimeric outer membrane transporter n=1 Tax=Dokdonella sp. TaxID=2291710 RepID=UPI0037847228
MYRQLRHGLRLSAIALACGLAFPAIAAADTKREAALEQRVSDLERQVQDLMSEVRAQHAAQVAAQAAPAAPVAANAPLPKATATVGGKPPIQETTITPGASPNTTFRFGGFVKADFMATRTGDGQLADGASGRALYVPGQTPVGGHGSGTDFDAHAKFSRFNFGVDTLTDNGDKLGAFLEMDFFGNSLGTQVATNTYGVTVRHAYAYWNNWLAGQTWSNFVDPSAFPESVDFIGPTDGVVFVRQAQVRYTNGGLSVSLENPETTIIPNGGGAPIQSDRGAIPDLTLRYGWKGDWGTFGVGALMRDLRIDRQATSTVTRAKDDQLGGAFTLGGKWVIGKNDDLRYQFTLGSGFSRYIGLGVTGDTEIDADGNLDTLDGMAGYVGWRHVFSPAWRTNLIYARSQYDNDLALTGGSATKSVQSLRWNMFYSPLPKLDIGAELMYGRRTIENGLDGDLTRLQFTTKYSF